MDEAAMYVLTSNEIIQVCGGGIWSWLLSPMLCNAPCLCECVDSKNKTHSIVLLPSVEECEPMCEALKWKLHSCVHYCAHL